MSIGVIITIYFHPIQHHISTNDLHLTEGKQNTKLAECHIPYTVPECQHFYHTTGLWAQANNILSRISTSDGAHSATGIQAETERRDVSACTIIKINQQRT